MLRSLILRTLVTNLTIASLALLNTILLSRWLGPAGRGEVAAAVLWPTALIYLSSFGLISSSLYFATLTGSKPNVIFSNGVVLALAQSLVAIGLGFVALPWLLSSQSQHVVDASRLYLLVIPLSLVSQYGISILQGRMRITSFNLLRSIIPAGYLVGTLSLFALAKLTLFNIVVLHLCLNVIVLVGTLVALVRAGVIAKLQPDAALARRMLWYGGKAHVGNATGLANQNLDQMLMAAWLPPVHLGLYVVAVSSASMSQMFSQAVQMVATPGIAQKESNSERASVLQTVFRRYWLISFLITLLLGLLLPVAIPAVFGASFRESVLPAEVLLLGAFLIGAKDVLAGGANAMGNPWLSSKAQLWAMPVTLGLLWILLPAIGILGAAVASAAAYGIQLLVVVYGLRVTHGVSLSELFHIGRRDVVSALNIFGALKAQGQPSLSDRGPEPSTVLH